MSESNGQESTESVDKSLSEKEITMGEMRGGDSVDGQAIQAIREFLPDGDDQLAKARLEPDQVAPIASLIVLTREEDLIDERTEETVKLWLELMMKGQLSVEGKSREEIIRTFETMGSKSSGQTIMMGGEVEEDEEDEGWFSFL